MRSEWSGAHFLSGNYAYFAAENAFEPASAFHLTPRTKFIDKNKNKRIDSCRKKKGCGWSRISFAKSSRERRARRLRRRCTARYDTASSTVELSCTTMRPSETREDAGDWDHIQASGLLVGSGDSRLVVLLLSEFLLWIKVHTNNHW